MGKFQKSMLTARATLGFSEDKLNQGRSLTLAVASIPTNDL